MAASKPPKAPRTPPKQGRPIKALRLFRVKDMAVREKGEEAVFVQKVVHLEKELGGAGLAKIAGVDPSRISRWKRGDKADPANREKINGLEYIITRLHGFLAPGSEEKWLNGFNAYLNNRRPIDLIEDGRVAEVIAAIEQSELGSYA